MIRVFLVNKRPDPSDPHLFASVEYDFGGHTRILPPDSRTEVGEAEAQVCLSRWQMAGVSVERVNDAL